MNNVSVIDKGTTLLSIVDNTEIDNKCEAIHCCRISPTIEINSFNKTASFNVNFESEFESEFHSLRCEPLYILNTLSQFELTNYIAEVDEIEILEDYILLAYRKHLSILTVALTNQRYIDKLKNNLEVYQYKSSLETSLFLAIKYCLDC